MFGLILPVESAKQLSCEYCLIGHWHVCLFVTWCHRDTFQSAFKQCMLLQL